MLYTLLALFIVLVAGFIAFKAIKMLWFGHWFLGWLKGMFGLALTGLAMVVGVVGYDIYSYKQVLPGQPVATISFEPIENQYFDAVVVDANGNTQRIPLRGDQWQLDARVIQWQGYLASLNIKPAYRLDKLSGRFYDIQKEAAAKRSDRLIVSSPMQIDLWRLMNEHPSWFPIVNASYGSPRYYPMKAGALYEISLTLNGLSVRPLNDVATSAMSEWNK